MWGAVDVMPASKAQPHSAMLKHCLYTVLHYMTVYGMRYIKYTIII